MKSTAIDQIALDLLGAWEVWAALITAIGVIIGAKISRPTRRTRWRPRPRKRSQPTSLSLPLRPRNENGRVSSSESAIITIVIECPVVSHQTTTPILLRAGKNVQVLSGEQKPTIPTSISDRTQLEFSLM